MSQLGPAAAEPKNETQARAKAMADASAAEADAKNADKAAHDANEAKVGGRDIDNGVPGQVRRPGKSETIVVASRDVKLSGSET